MIRTPLVLACAALLAGATAYAQAPSPSGSPQEPVVVTTGEGTAQGAPDRAWISVSAESRAPSPREAQRRNVELMTPVQEALKAARIPDDAMRTTGYDLQQEFDFVNGKRVARGYLARNSIEIRVDDVTRVGELLETVVKQGATTVSGLRFDLKDQGKLEREAVRQAVSNARLKAEAAAAGAGRSIDRAGTNRGSRRAGASRADAAVPDSGGPGARGRPAAGCHRPDRGPRASDGDLQPEIGLLHRGEPPLATTDYTRARRHLARRDPVLRDLMRAHGKCGLAEAQNADPFGALLKAIVSQQLSTKAATTIYTRLMALFDGVPTPLRGWPASPTTSSGPRG